MKGAGTIYIDPGSPWDSPWIKLFNGRLRDDGPPGSTNTTNHSHRNWTHIRDPVMGAPHLARGHVPKVKIRRNSDDTHVDPMSRGATATVRYFGGLHQRGGSPGRHGPPAFCASGDRPAGDAGRDAVKVDFVLVVSYTVFFASACGGLAATQQARSRATHSHADTRGVQPGHLRESGCAARDGVEGEFE